LNGKYFNEASCGGEAAVIGPEKAWIGELVSVCGFKNGREATDEMRMDILGFARKEMGLPSLRKKLNLSSIPKTAERY
jgi:hypothetical protein